MCKCVQWCVNEPAMLEETQWEDSAKSASWQKYTNLTFKIRKCYQNEVHL